MSAFIRKNRIHTAAIIAATLFFIAPHTGIRTATGQPDDTTGNAVLADTLKKGSIGELTWWGGTPFADDICKWSSSHLGATGRPPAKPVPVAGQDDDEAGYEYYRKYEAWSCMYSALGAMDGDTATAWSEGKKDEGIGEILIVRVDTTKPVRIWNGLGASENLFRANNRVEKARVWALQAKRVRREIGQYEIGTVFQDITAVGSHEIILRDLNGWQPLPLPARKKLSFESEMADGKPVVSLADATFIAVEILSVYRGSKYNDTCISEIGADAGKK